MQKAAEEAPRRPQRQQDARQPWTAFAGGRRSSRDLQERKGKRREGEDATTVRMPATRNGPARSELRSTGFHAREREELAKAAVPVKDSPAATAIATAAEDHVTRPATSSGPPMKMISCAVDWNAYAVCNRAPVKPADHNACMAEASGG